ncbi:hypothetical protein [Streptomyces sp. NPDC051561]|uniref:hypothetical protein n=1 Tax=Streptomyces sp. NPDC051561 TaxID=3365658 RepID=UPI00378B7CCF
MHQLILSSPLVPVGLVNALAHLDADTARLLAPALLAAARLRHHLDAGQDHVQEAALPAAREAVPVVQEGKDPRGPVRRTLVHHHLSRSLHQDAPDR